MFKEARLWAIVAFTTLLVASASLPLASALTVTVPDDSTVADLAAPPGEPLVILSPGSLTLRGIISTHPTPEAGTRGPDITIRAAGTVVLLGASIQAADGNAGTSQESSGLAIGSDGGKGGNVSIIASHIIALDSFLRVGNGGAGGDAIAHGTPSVKALGGKGGNGGSFSTVPTPDNGLTYSGGNGGNGGNATAQAKDACESRDGTHDVGHRGKDGLPPEGRGEDANAAGTDGGCGPPDGAGGTGGDAEAYGGNGGASTSTKGGRGGNATAIGGRGGDGADACFASTEEAIASGLQHAGNGGLGGVPHAEGGNGGDGPDGGDGGNAYTSYQGGRGGNATEPIQMGTGGQVHPPERLEHFITKGGTGGRGLVGIGGKGGDAVSDSHGGLGGGNCGPLPVQRLPLPSVPVVVAILALATFLRRR